MWEISTVSRSILLCLVSHLIPRRVIPWLALIRTGTCEGVCIDSLSECKGGLHEWGSEGETNSRTQTYGGDSSTSGQARVWTCIHASFSAPYNTLLKHYFFISMFHLALSFSLFLSCALVFTLSSVFLIIFQTLFSIITFSMTISVTCVLIQLSVVW